MRNVQFNSHDFELFDPEITRQDYDFFKKHTGAFKRLLEDQTLQQKRKFVDAFIEFTLKHCCTDEFLFTYEQLSPFVYEVKDYLDFHFAMGKLSSAKSLVLDAVCLQQNRNFPQWRSTSCYAKDPFFHKDTRDVFRRLFGHPTEGDACLKAVFVLPLYVKFAGSICRYLRRWLDAEDEIGTVPTSSSTVKVSLDSQSTVTSSVTYESDRSKTTTETTSATVVSTTKSTCSVVAEAPPNPSGSIVVGVASIGRGEASKETSSSSDDDDDNWETKFIRGLSTAGHGCMELYKLDKDGSYMKLRSEFLLDKPHPDQAFEEKWETKKANSLENKQHEGLVVDGDNDSKIKRHACANCRKVEKCPKQFKKCQRCKGKGTKFYCSRKCQGEDWVSKHRAEHL